MKKLKIFARTFRKSLTSPAYYQDILSAKFSFSFKYLIFLLFLASLLFSFKAAIGLAKIRPKVPSFITEAKKVISEIYPDELVLTIRNKKITTNVIEPYSIDFPDDKKIPVEGYKHLLTINTRASIDDFQKYNSVFLLAGDYIVTPDNEGRSYKVLPLDDYLKKIPDGAYLNKGLYLEMVKKALPYFDYLPRIVDLVILFLIVLSPILITGLSLLGKLLFLLIYSFFLWLLALVLKRGLSYAKVFQMSMHGLTLPILLGAFLSLINFPIPFVSTIIFLVWMIVILKRQLRFVPQVR